jgi:hypothetical protein
MLGLAVFHMLLFGDPIARVFFQAMGGSDGARGTRTLPVCGGVQEVALDGGNCFVLFSASPWGRGQMLCYRVASGTDV